MAPIPSGESTSGIKPGRPALLPSAAHYTVRRAVAADLPRWRELYAQYAEHYRVTVDPVHHDRVWSWGMDPEQATEIWLAIDGSGVAQGLAHIRPFTRPLAGSVGGFLDDLVVDQAARRTGAVDALMLALAQTAFERKWTVLRWITADDNHRARMVYDAYATRTMWLTYDMAPALTGDVRRGFAEKIRQFTIRPIQPEDLPRWRHLYAQFAQHYTVPVDAAHQDELWEWLLDPAHPLSGVLAIDPAGVAQGLAHFRPFARPLVGSVGCFLDDLLVDKAARRSGAADALLIGLREMAVAENWIVVRWLTADDNYRARQVYDAYGTRTMWVTYDMAPQLMPEEMKGVLQ